MPDLSLTDVIGENRGIHARENSPPSPEGETGSTGSILPGTGMEGREILVCEVDAGSPHEGVPVVGGGVFGL